ncbi:N-acyl homoserine lactonase family protein [Patulibacter defluvii]|uniref:N-acyl homoserine lactonase family protein n=1 Tax=Patulibacter defluvii TaxID=3095358 RepID=UPI002A74ECEE|nr:N-acyl homoserine lactonase family protein [Patulibacter sp. DM4]
MSADDRCDRLIGLTLGWEHCARRISIEDGGDERLRLPVIAFLAHGPGGWTLLDCGLSPTMRDRERAARIYPGPPPEFPGEGDPLLDALDACGVPLDAITTVAVSHLHVDHSGGLAHVADGRPVVVQAPELAFAATPAAAAAGYVAEDWAAPGLAWRPIAGDAPIAPGIDAVATPGHTPGHMSYRVRTTAGPWLLAMDAIDLQDGIDEDRPIGSAARPEDDPLRRRSHDRLLALAAAEGARLVPGHCPRTWPAFPGPPAGVALPPAGG